MPPAGILQTEMDEETLLELELQQELERINLDNDDFVADNPEEEININDDALVAGEDLSGSADGEGLPSELQDYLDTIQKQRLRFEEELEECDALIETTVANVRGESRLATSEDNEEKGVVSYEDWKELEEGAALAGLTVEEYKRKLLQDLEDEPFELEEMDFLTEENDFQLPSSRPVEDISKESLSDADSQNERALVPVPEPSEEDQMVEKALALARALEAEHAEKAGGERRAISAVPAAEDGAESSRREGSGGAGELVPYAATAEGGHQQETMEPATTAVEDGLRERSDAQSLVPVVGEEEEEGVVAESKTSEQQKPGETEGAVSTVAVIRSNPMLEFEQYLREQFQLAQETFQRREEQLKQELEAQRQVEEKLMLAMEEHKLQTKHTLQEEEQRLAHQKQESQKRLEREIEQQQQVWEKELKKHEETISALTAQLEEDRYQLDKVQRAEEERVAQKTSTAATTIQRHYKGYRVRKLHQAERQTLAEKKEQRKEEKQRQRIEEIEYEIQQRKDEEARKEEEARRTEEEEEGKIAEEKRRVEEECKRKEEEERRRKEEEERKIKEEKERKQREAEEAKRRKEEEERKQREAEERRKEEEERQKREAEEKKRKEEEERKKAEEEERKRREEEERRQAEEAEHKRLEEEKRKQEEEQKQQAEKERLEEEERRRKEEEERKAMEEEERREREEEEKEKLKQESVNSKNLENEIQKTQGDLQNHLAERSGKNIEKSGSESEPKEFNKNGYSVSPVEFTLEPVNANNLPASLEDRRLAWMKQCLPWSKVSNEPWKAKSGSTAKAHRRPASAKKLAPLPADVILQTARVDSLRKVTTVELRDLPGHSISTLSTCLHLKHLTLTHCGLIAIEGLSQCKHLQSIDVQDNLIEFVDLRELGSVYTLNLSHNKLSSIHGLDGCSNLRWLDASHNRLTKLVGLSPLRRLHTLRVSNNQLVSTAGLELCPTIQQLDLSANYLTSVQGLDKLGLLLSLDIASNNLTLMPSLANNILLQELILRENSIGPDLDLSAAWLPLLVHLDLSQNIIEELKGSAAGLFVMKRLDLAVNQITEVSSFLPALQDCPRLEDLSLQGNAVLDEDNLRENVKNSMLCLVCLNGETLRSQAAAMSSAGPTKSFEVMCLTQLQLHKDIKQTLEKDIRMSQTQTNSDGTHLCDDYFKYCCKSFKLAVEHRYAHEYGELSTANFPAAPPTPHSSRPSSGRSPKVSAQARRSTGITGDPSPGSEVADNSSTATGQAGPPASVVHREEEQSPSPRLTQKEKFEMALRAGATKAENSVPHSISQTGHLAAGGATVWTDSVGGESVLEGKMETELLFSELAAINRHAPPDHGQQQYQSPPQMSEKEKFERVLAGLPPNPSPLPPVGFSNGRHDVSEVRSDGVQKKQGQGSGAITADLVGGLMMSETAGVSRSDFPDQLLEEFGDLDDLEEMMEGLQFDLDGFLDLEQFDFDEDFLEKGWRPEDTPQLPQNYPVLARIPSSISSSSKPPLPPVPSIHLGAGKMSPAPPPGRPAQAWHNAPDTPVSDVQGKVPPLRPPSSVASGEDSQAITTGRSKREDRLAEEWGFKDSRTAEMMMQRAKKMKYNSERRKKLSKLDPKQRLQLFRKLEQVKGVRAVRPPPPRVLPRKEYFQAREEEAQQREMEKQMEYKTRAGRTFEWLHTQVGDYDVSSSRINPKPAAGGHSSESPMLKTTSDSQLSHHMSPSPHGYSPMSMDMDSALGYSGQHHHPRPQRHSLTGEELTLTGHGTTLPPIKTGSAPSTRSRDREKMSWRTEPVEKSVGWGGGKKRTVRK